MRKIYFLFLFVLIASMSGLQAQEEILLYETGFESSEGFKSSTTYNNANLKLVGPANQQWGTICGTPSINSVISGEQSMQMRYYNNVGAAPYVLMDFDLQNVSKVVYKAKTANESNNTLLVQHSTDGGDTWSEGESYSLTTSVSEFTYVVEGENTDVRFKFTATNTPVEKKGIIIDDVKVYGEARLTAPIISGVVNDETYYGSATVSISYPELATSMTYTITKDGAQYKQETVTAAVEDLALNEAGAYKVEVTATNGTNTTTAEAVEFTIVDGGKYTVTDHDGTTLVTAGAEGTWTLSKTLTHGQSGNTKGYQLGSSKNPMGEFTLTLDKEYENIVSVIVNAATGGSCTLSVTVGGNAFGEEVSLTEESADYEFTGNASGNVTLNFNASEKACYLKSIIIITSGNDTPVTKCAAPEFSLAEGTYNETQTLTITSTEGSTIVYTINDEKQTAPSPAEIELPVDGVAVTYTIEAYATMEGAEDSEVVTKTYTIDPNAVLPQSLVVKISEVADENGWEASVSNNGTQYKSFTKDNFEFTIDATDANSGKYYSNSDGESWRVYKGASLTISAPASVEITGVEFVTGKWNCSGANTGSLQGKVWTATEEKTSSVTFSMDGSSEILEMHISYKAVPAGVEGVEAADAAVRTNADGVVVTADGAVAEVYNAAGQLVAAEAVDGERVIALPAGFYIVRVGDTTAKVVVR